MTYPQQNKKNLKRKLARRNSFDDLKESEECNVLKKDFSKDSTRKDGDENESESLSIRPFWTAYCKVYDKLAESVSKVQTTDECIVTSRIVDITSAKLAQEIQKLDLSSIDHWITISSKLVRNWNHFFVDPENNGWSFGDLIPLSCYKTNYFGHRNILLKRKDSDEHKVVNDKKKRIVKRDENRAKLSKPLEGKSDDKPLPLLEHMKRVISAIKTNCVNGHKNVEYLQLVIDPNSFSSTVYNIFTISFLIREDLVSLDIGKKGELLLSLKPASSSQKNKDNEQGKNHFITCLTTSEWKELVKKLGITSAMVSCPDSSTEDDRFFERFSQSQKERNKKKNK